jgi:hypothetical protein
MDRIKIKRPYDKHIDEALEHGFVEVPAYPDGFQLARKREELESAIDIRTIRHNVFQVTRTEEVIQKVFEGDRYSLYERKFKKWNELI